MDIVKMTRKDFMKLPHKNWQEKVECTSFVVVPCEINYWHVCLYYMRKFLADRNKLFRQPEIHEIDGMHYSGGRSIYYALIRNGEPVCLTNSRSDTLHLDGIGGYGQGWVEKYGCVPSSVPPSGWTAGCLPRSGFLHFWCNSTLITGTDLSSFEIFSVK